MHGSCELVVTRKTKFGHGNKEEEFRKNSHKKTKHKRNDNKNECNGFDMWEDDPNDGC